MSIDYISELKKVFPNSRREGNNIRVGPCPHCRCNCTVSVNLYGSNVPIGTFHCWGGCGWSGSWNKLAKKFNLKKQKLNSLDDEAHRLLNKSKEENIKEEIKKFELKRWTGNWRGAGEKILLALGAKLWYDIYQRKEKPPLITKRIWFPVYNDEDERIAYISSIIDEKERNKRKDKWKNSKGVWAKDTLWPMHIIGETKVVALVEGPFDFIHLFSNGIPALTFLGVENWKQEKTSLLASLGVEVVIPLPDNDKAGRLCMKKMIPQLEEKFDVRYYPYESKDPGIMTKKEIKSLQILVDTIIKES